MKKFLAFMLALVMVLSLVACGEKKPDGGEEKDPSQEQQGDDKPTYEVPEGRELVMYWSTYGASTAEHVDVFIKEFNEKQDEYFVVREYNGGYYDQIAKLMATEKKNLPALCNSSSETVGAYKHSGLIKRVQDFIDADTTFKRDPLFGPLTATYGDADGMIGYPIGFSLAGIYFNKEVFEAAGVDPYSISSFEELYAALLKICDGGYAKYGIGEEHSGIWANYCFAREGYYTVDGANASTGLPTKCLYDSNDGAEQPDGRTGFADVVKGWYGMWADLAAKGYVYPIGSSMKDELEPAMATGDLACFISTNSAFKRIQTELEANNYHLGFLPMLTATEKGKGTGFCCSGNGMFIIDNGNEKAMQGAWEFLKYFTDVEQQIRWNDFTSYMPLYDAVYKDSRFQASLEGRDDFAASIEAVLAGDRSAFYAFTATNNEYTLPGATCLEAVCNGTPVDEAIAAMCETINDAFEMYNLSNS